MGRNNFFINRALEIFLSHLNGIVPACCYAFNTDDPRNQYSNLRYSLCISVQQVYTVPASESIPCCYLQHYVDVDLMCAEKLYHKLVHRPRAT